ncbi:MAG: hypothetical protein LBR25_05985 [Erysipelotrichaceae bacterium]|nr:hypothetical protein [Erysipelotrichaceae bacterium]
MKKVIVLFGLVLLVLSGCGAKNNNTSAGTVDVTQSGGTYYTAIDKDGVTTVYAFNGDKLGSVDTALLVEQRESAFDGGYAVIKDNGIYSIIDTKGKAVYKAPEKYEIKKVGLDAFVIKNDHYDYALADHNGKVIVDYEVWDSYSKTGMVYRYETNNYIKVKGEESDLYGVITTTGEVVLQDQYEDIDITYQGMAAVIVADNEKFVVINGKKDILLSTANASERFHLPGFPSATAEKYQFVMLMEGNEAKKLYVIRDGKAQEVSGYAALSCYQGDANYAILFKGDDGGFGIYDVVNNKILASTVSDDTGTICDVNHPMVATERNSASDIVEMVTIKGTYTFDRLDVLHPLGLGYFYRIDYRVENCTTDNCRSYYFYDEAGNLLFERFSERASMYDLSPYDPIGIFGTDADPIFVLYDANTDDAILVNKAGEVTATVQGVNVRNPIAVAGKYFSFSLDMEMIDAKGNFIGMKLASNDALTYGNQVFEQGRYYGVVKDGKVGAYDFVSDKFVVEAAYDSISGVGGNFKITLTADGENHYFALSGKELK